MTANKQQQQLILAMQSMALYNSIKNHENLGGHMPTAQRSHMFLDTKTNSSNTR